MEEIKPTDPAPLVRAEGEAARLEIVKWGFAPARPKMPPVINFRSDGRTFGRGKALAPASHFFEFTEPADKKQKRKDQWTFTAQGGDLFCMAALWRPAQSDWPASYSLLTREPGPDVQPFHSREIILVPQSMWRTWLFDDSYEGDDLPTLPAGSLKVVKSWPPAEPRLI
jgi:putative SOS response-associated peptidase YedK